MYTATLKAGVSLDGKGNSPCEVPNRRLLHSFANMIFVNPNSYRQGSRQYSLHNDGVVSSSGHSSRQPLPGNRRNLGVNLGRGEFSTAILVVFSLGGFLFVCGIFMLIGGLGDHSKLLVGLGVASAIGGMLLSVMGWTLCFKLRRKRNQDNQRSSSCATTHQPPREVTTVGPPPAYSPLPVTPEGETENSLDAASPVVSVQYHRQDGHVPASHPDYLMEDQVVFNFPPPSYDEALKSRGV